MPQGLSEITTNKVTVPATSPVLVVMLILGIFYFAYAKILSTSAGQIV